MNMNEGVQEASLIQKNGTLSGNRDKILAKTANDLSVPNILVVAGPSGVGKGSILSQLRTKYKGKIEVGVSHTTRKPREGETHGIDYYFTPKDEILNAVDKGLFLEHANLFGNVYGTSLNEVLRIRCDKKICILEIDLQGVKSVLNSPLRGVCNTVFIDAPPHELELRLRKRGTESPETLKRRLDEACKEIQEATKIDFDFRFTNLDFDSSVKDLERKVLEWYPYLQTDHQLL